MIVLVRIMLEAKRKRLPGSAHVGSGVESSGSSSCVGCGAIAGIVLSAMVSMELGTSGALQSSGVASWTVTNGITG